jgi:hypothetical protein
VCDCFGLTHPEYDALPVDTIDGLLTIHDTVEALEAERIRHARHD